MCFSFCFHFPFPFLSLCVSSVVSTSRSSCNSALLIDSSFCGFLWALVRLLLNFMFGFWPRKFFGFLKLVCELRLPAGCLCCSCRYPYCVLFQWEGLALVELLYVCDCCSLRIFGGSRVGFSDPSFRAVFPFLLSS